jgi:manganese transport protein
LLVLGQVVLSLGLPFTIWPLVSSTSNRNLIGPFANSAVLKIAAWIIFAVITAVNTWLLYNYL